MNRLAVAEATKQNRHAALQSNIVRAYKVFGLVALVAILLGLAWYLVVSMFYLMDHSWVRPVILNPSHPQVVDTQARLLSLRHQLEEARERLDAARAERDLFASDMAVLSQFQKDFDAVAPKLGKDSYEAVIARRERAQSNADKLRIKRNRMLVENRIKAAEANVAGFERLIEKVSQTPHAMAADKEVFVAFVAYDNLDVIEPGAPIYGCKWGLVRCSFVGNVADTLEGEVTDLHPHNGSSLRGVYVEIDLRRKWAAKEQALFVGGRPLWVF